MSTLITVLHVIVCLFLMLTVLLQSGKGGGMGGAFGGSNAGTVFGGSGASTFLRKLTAGAATIFMMTSMVLAFIASHNAADALEKFGESQQKAAKEKELARKQALEGAGSGSAGSNAPSVMMPHDFEDGSAGSGSAAGSAGSADAGSAGSAATGSAGSLTVPAEAPTAAGSADAKPTPPAQPTMGTAPAAAKPAPTGTPTGTGPAGTGPLPEKAKPATGSGASTEPGKLPLAPATSPAPAGAAPN